MPVAPPTECELWSAVAPLTRWPVSDEDTWASRALGWTNAGAAFLGTGSSGSAVDSALATGWPDEAGREYRTRAAGLYGTALDVGQRMKRIAWHAEQYADDVKYAKTSIAALVRENEPLYQDLTRFFFWPDNAARARFAAMLATAINDFLDLMALRIAARGTGEEAPRPEFVERSEDDPEVLTGPGSKKKAAREPSDADREFAKQVGINNAASPAVLDRSMSVTKFIEQYRKASIRGEFPSEMLDGTYTVEQALRSGGPTVRKLLLDGRFAK
ncbi:MAG: hypothetical protein HOY78_36725 [Saccharothrix sp.]|nr:hypothetical protein [Saccharothrix sp.]